MKIPKWQHKLVWDYKREKLVSYFLNNPSKTRLYGLKTSENIEIEHVFQSRIFFHLSSNLHTNSRSAFKEHMSYNVRQGLGKIDESIEIFWIEVQGRNKNILVLTGVIYQPNSNETEKLIWLEKFERKLTEIYLKWSGVIVVVDDFNIDLLNGNKQSQRLYKDILHLFSLRQHITKATGKSKH